MIYIIYGTCIKILQKITCLVVIIAIISQLFLLTVVDIFISNYLVSKFSLQMILSSLR